MLLHILQHILQHMLQHMLLLMLHTDVYLTSITPGEKVKPGVLAGLCTLVLCGL